MTPFGNFLEQVRRSRCLQQNDLATRLGVKPCYISSMERGRKGPPSSDLINKIKTELDLNAIEVQLLETSIYQSQRVIKLPENTSLEEYAFIAHLRRRIGSLNHEEVEAMKHILSLGDKAGRREGNIMS